jgi:hypothetical protein
MGDKVFYMMINFQNRSHGLVVRAATCEARGPGFNASSDEMFFFSSGIRRNEQKMGADMVNCMICVSM